MVEEFKIIKDEESEELDQAIESSLYQKLFKAIKEKDEETIRNLSKIITKYRLK